MASVEQMFKQMFGANEVISTTPAPKKTTRKTKAKTESIEEQTASDAPKKTSYQFTYRQVKDVSNILSQKLNIKFWILLSKDEQEAEKATPTETIYYRLGYCNYNNFDLLNIMRFFQDPTKKVKGKSYATINLKNMKCTTNSQNKFVLSSDEQVAIRKAFGIEEPLA
jgi:hypothetical protein